MSSFKNDSKEDIVSLLKLMKEKQIEISKSIADDLITKCLIFNLEEEIQFISSITIMNSQREKNSAQY